MRGIPRPLLFFHINFVCHFLIVYLKILYSITLWRSLAWQGAILATKKNIVVFCVLRRGVSAYTKVPKYAALVSLLKLIFRVFRNVQSASPRSRRKSHENRTQRHSYERMIADTVLNLESHMSLHDLQGVFTIFLLFLRLQDFK